MKNKALFFISIIILLVQSIGNYSSVKAQESDYIWRSSIDDVKYLDFSPNGKYIACNTDWRLHILDAENGNIVFSYDNIKEAVFSLDNKYVIGHWFNDLIVINIATWDTIKFETGGGNLGEISFNETGDNIIVPYTSGLGFGIWDINTGKKIIEKFYPELVTGDWMGGTSGNIYFCNNAPSILWNYGLGKQVGSDIVGESHLCRISINDYKIYQDVVFNYGLQAISKNKEYFAVKGKANQAATIFRQSNYEELFSIPGYSNSVSDIAFSPDEKYVCISYDFSKGTIEVWDISTKDLVFTYTWEPEQPINYGIYRSVSVSADGKYIIASTREKIYLYNSYWSQSSINEKLISGTFYFPNPTDKIGKLSFTLTDSNVTKIDVIDISGTLVKNFENSFLSKGEHNYDIDFTELASGTYFLRIQSGNSSFTQKVELIK